MADSIVDEVSGARFGDKRLSKRLEKMALRLGAYPNMSIPAATYDRAEMEAAYRFCDNCKVSPKAISAPHIAATLSRIRKLDAAILVQDTTEINLTRPEQQVVGSGPLESNSRFGMYHHPLMAFDESGLCLGTAWSKSWCREEIRMDVTPEEKNGQRKAIPIEQKESYRWLEGNRAALQVANACPNTECVCVADSEADIYELFSEPRTTMHSGELHFLIRACQDRAVNDAVGCMVSAVRATPCLFDGTIDVSRRRTKINTEKNNAKNRSAPRDSRIAEIQGRATTLALRPPYRPDRKLAPIQVNIVLVEEPNPPAGQTPIQWVLVTTLPIDTVEQVQRIVRIYSIRWQIEVYFKILKSGCRVEERYFERIGRLQNCMALYAIVAWRILYLCRLSRECPELNCEVVFAPCEWKAVHMAVKHTPPPKTPPTLNEIVRMVASLGGYVVRNSTQPGTQTLWIGLQRLHDLATAWNAFGPESQAARKFFSS